MKAVAYRLRCGLRSRWRATLGLSVIVALVGGVVLAFAAGTQRTSSAPDRYTESQQNPFDGIMQQERGLPRTDELAALPGAVEVKSATFVFGGLARADSPDEDVDAIVFGGDVDAVGGHLSSGRAADPATHEFVATQTFVDANRAVIGDTFLFRSITQEHADRAGFSSDDLDGPQFDDAVLVGILDNTADGDPTAKSEPVAVFPPSLLALPDIGLATSVMSLRLDPGVSLESFRTEMDTLPDADSFVLQPSILVSDTVRTAVQAQGRGLWLLAAVAAIAAIAALGQLITRQVRLTPAEQSRLSAVGFTDRQIFAESIGRAGVPIIAGTVVAVVLATVASGIFPTGFVRRLEPDPGLHFETAVLVLAAVGLLAALMAWSAVAFASRRSRSAAFHPSAVIDNIATMTPSATAATGVRFAFSRGERDIGSVRTSVAGLLMTVVGIVGALTFASSLDRLVSDRARFGYGYDIGFGSGQTSVSADLRAALDNDPDISALMLLAGGQARVGIETLRVIGMEPIRGGLVPKVVAGRLPSSEDEIALGRLSARHFGVGVGDVLTVSGPDDSRDFRVTGLAVVPSVGSNDGVGQDAIVTMAALQRLDASADAESAVLNIRPGAPPGTAERIMTDNGAPPGPGDEETLPPVVTNLRRVRAIPYVLAALLGALGILTVAHVMITSMRNRRRDVAIVRALGADRSWITRAVHWQSTSFTLLPIVIGTPIGVIAGQLVFKKFADSAGTVDDASFPFLLLAGVVVALVLLANVVAEVPARRARRLSPAELLQAE